METKISDCGENRMNAAREHGGYVSSDEVMDNEFVFQISRVAREANANARRKGFYDNPQPNGVRFMLMVSEIAEAMEGERHGNPPSDKIPEFSSVEEELADCVIRIFDFSVHNNVRLGEAILAKMKMNAGRPHMHGGKAY